MVKTFRSSKVMKFIDKLRVLRQAELEHTLIFGNHLRGQFGELFGNSKVHEQDDVYKLVDTITEYSYKEDGLNFSHSQLSFFHETMFHLGGINIVDNIIKEMGEFFDLDIPERKKRKSDLENYRIKSIDTTDYSNTPRDFYLIIGGMDESFSEEIQEQCYQHCLTILLRFLKESEVIRAEKGFVIQTALQNIPNISNELIKNDVGIYGIIPVEEENEN
jgi:hypothetical protein